MPRGGISKRSARLAAGGGGPAVATPLLAFPNVAAMAAYDTTAFVDGAVAEVQTLLDTFLLDKTSALPVTPTTVVNATGGGQWLRMAIASLQWMNQQQWYVAFTAGNDEAPGTNVAPIKTMAEYIRRVGKGPLLDTNIAFQEDSSENVVYDLNSPGNVEIVGVTSTSFTGTISGAVQASAAGSVAAQITAAALPVSWTASGLVGKIGVLTSGASNGRSFVVSADLAAKTARITQPSGANPILSYAFANGDTFDMQVLPRLTGIWRVTSAPGKLFGGFLELNTWEVSSGDPLFSACEVLLPVADGSGRPRFVGSRVDDSRVFESAELYVFACSMTGTTLGSSVTVGPLGMATLEETIVEGGGAGTTGILGDELVRIRILTYVGVFGSEDAVRIGGLARLDTTQARLFGTGNTLLGIGLGAGAQVVYSSVGFLPNILAPAVQVQLGGLAITYAQLPYTNPIDGAAVLDDTAPNQVEDQFADLAADVTVGAGTTADLLSTTINCNGTRLIQIWGSFSVTEGALGQGLVFLQIDGVTVVSCELGVANAAAFVCRGSLNWQASVAAGAHTIRIRATAVTANIFCRGSTQRAIEHCNIMIKELYG